MNNKQNIENELKEKIAASNVLMDELLSKHTTYRIGGPADVFVIPTSKEEFIHAVKVCRINQADYFILGKGSNLLVSDEGFRGVVIKVSDNLSEIIINDDEIYAEAGASLISVSYKAFTAGLEGMEFACGIPGTIGGAVYMNAGAYASEMKNVISEVELLDQNNEVVRFTNEQMNFGYRYSILKENGYIVLSAKIKLNKGDMEAMKAKRDHLKEHRQNGQPLELPSAGSVFKRPEGYYTGKLIEDLGLKGYTIGGAQVSPKHANFIVNIGDATAKDVINLVKYVQHKVYESYGVVLEPEIRVLGNIDN